MLHPHCPAADEVFMEESKVFIMKSIYYLAKFGNHSMRVWFSSSPLFGLFSGPVQGGFTVGRRECGKISWLCFNKVTGGLGGCNEAEDIPSLPLKADDLPDPHSSLHMLDWTLSLLPSGLGGLCPHGTLLGSSRLHLRHWWWCSMLTILILQVPDRGKTMEGFGNLTSASATVLFLETYFAKMSL